MHATKLKLIRQTNIDKNRHTKSKQHPKKSTCKTNHKMEDFQNWALRFAMDNHSWCYAACIQCHKKTNVYTEPFVCPCGKHNDNRANQESKIQHMSAVQA